MNFHSLYDQGFARIGAATAPGPAVSVKNQGQLAREPMRVLPALYGRLFLQFRDGSIYPSGIGELDG